MFGSQIMSQYCTVLDPAILCIEGVPRFRMAIPVLPDPGGSHMAADAAGAREGKAIVLGHSTWQRGGQRDREMTGVPTFSSPHAAVRGRRRSLLSLFRDEGTD